MTHSTAAPSDAPCGAGAATVQPDSFLTLHYRLAGPSGDVVNTFTDGHPGTLSLGAGHLSPALEARLLGLPEGSRATFELAAGAAFGERNPAMLQWLPRSELDELGEPGDAYHPGEVVQFPTPDGQGVFAGAVVQVNEESGAVLFDFNHPLAGHPVTFEVHLLAVL